VAAARLIFDACRNNPLEPQVAHTAPSRLDRAGDAGRIGARRSALHLLLKRSGHE
jgi:hypothetical protein